MAHERSHESVVTGGSRGHGDNLPETKKHAYEYTKPEDPDFKWNDSVYCTQ